MPERSCFRWNYWTWFGNTTIMLMAAVMGISTEVFEAADLDGCNATYTEETKEREE